MEPVYQSEGVTLYQADSLQLMTCWPADSIDAVITDPPAGISFMGKAWDHHKGGRQAWVTWMTEIMSECLRVVKPGGHAFVWALPRTSHWTATALELAGWEIREKVYHLFATGFPKSYNIAKGLESLLTQGTASWNEFHKLNGKHGKAGFITNGYVKTNADQGNRPAVYEGHGTLDLEPTTELAKQFAGWGSALKPAAEEWILCRKPLSEDSLAANVLKWGCGGLNIDATRIPAGEDYENAGFGARYGASSMPHFGGQQTRSYVQEAIASNQPVKESKPSQHGRWPANVIFDEFMAARLDEMSGDRHSGRMKAGTPRSNRNGYAGPMPPHTAAETYGDTGGVSRYFFTAKASSSERHRGTQEIGGNTHPTTKPLCLMQYLARLICPPNGLILDPFMGSGTTGVAARREGFRFIGIDAEAEYVEIARKRLADAENKVGLFAEEQD